MLRVTLVSETCEFGLGLDAIVSSGFKCKMRLSCDCPAIVQSNSKDKTRSALAFLSRSATKRSASTSMPAQPSRKHMSLRCLPDRVVIHFYMGMICGVVCICICKPLRGLLNGYSTTANQTISQVYVQAADLNPAVKYLFDDHA